MGESGAFDFDLIISELGQFREIGYAGDNALFYFDAVSDGKGVAIEAVTGYVSGILLESLYIKSNLKNLLRQSDLKWRIGATCDYLGLMVKHKTSGFSNKILSSPKDEKLNDEICREVQVSRSAVRKIIVNRGNEELWYGTRCQNLTRYTIVTATPLGPLKAHINSLWVLLVSVALMVFLATAIIGALLSEQFLRPINDLSRGIKSIEERNFTYRVPIHAPDELGEMSVLMNRVIDGMKDLEVARIVQENLFPQEYLDIGGYRIFGKSRAMSDIGGDYFDYFGIEGKIVGVIGDVSGHGVSAALIMGMAKCAFSTDEHLGRSLIENLASFNRFMLKTIKKKKMMTLFHYCLDTEKNIFYYSNAGHNTPFLWNDRKKESESLQIGGMPLGVRVKTTYEVVEIPLFPGDSIMMYTDGLVEAPDRHGGILGYPTAQQWFDDVSQLDSIEMVDGLFKRFEEYTRGTEPNDDVSIICLKRLR